jgi:hypothetical protein
MVHLSLIELLPRAILHNKFAPTVFVAQIDTGSLLSALITAVLGTLLGAVITTLGNIAVALINNNKYQDLRDFFNRIFRSLRSNCKIIFWFAIGTSLTTFLWLLLGGIPPSFLANIVDTSSSTIPVKNREVTIKENFSPVPFSALESDAIEVQIVKQPENGDVSVSQARQITYKPRKFVEKDSFTYRVKIGKLTSKLAIVEIKGVSVTDQLYDEFKQSLRAKDWRKADQYTKKIILRELNRSYNDSLNSIFLSPTDVEQICRHIKQLDQIWKDESNGNFGFTVQSEVGRRIFSQSNLTDEGKLSAFVKKVGWQSLEKSYDELYFNFNSPTSMPPGYLPAFLSMRASEWRDFFQAIQSCSSKKFGGELQTNN